MKIDISDFRSHKPKLVEIYKSKGVPGVTEFCALSSVALIAAYVLIQEEIDDTIIQDQITSLISFYGYTGIVK